MIGLKDAIEKAKNFIEKYVGDSSLSSLHDHTLKSIMSGFYALNLIKKVNRHQIY